MHHPLRPAALAVACALAAPGLIYAQTGNTQAAAPVPEATPAEIQLKAIVVTADPLGSGSDLFDLAPPVSVMDGRGLVLKRRSSLGETVTDLPGVSSTGFGPNASRPVIRGLDGDRVRILQNGAGMFDASAASPDHAVTIDPLAIDRIEVVRGPAALLYGGNAVGGVVNVIDGRIPQARMQGVGGAFEQRLGGPDGERGVSGRIDAGNGTFVIHGDAYGRTTSQQQIKGSPVSSRLQDMVNSGQATVTAIQRDAHGRLPNSDQRSDGGALGGSFFWDKGYAGVSASDMSTNYGTVGEPTVRIDMASKRYDAAGEIRDLGGFIQSIKFKYGASEYQHREINAGVVGTTFRSSGSDARVELQHAAIGRLQGMIGFQSTVSRLVAEGDEAFIPFNRTAGTAVFAYEEMALGALRLNFGGRYEDVKVRADPFAATGAAANARGFGLRSGGVGGIYPLAPGYALAVNGTYTERAPSGTELYADGPHAATQQFQIGNRNLGIERSRAIDFGVRKISGAFTGSAGVFINKFSDYIQLSPSIDPATGRQFYRDGDDRSVQSSNPAVWAGYGTARPQFNFTAVPATFRGAEFEGKYRAWESRGQRVDLTGRVDMVRASSNGQPLARIAPARYTIGAEYQHPVGLRAGIDATRVAAQNRIPTYPSVLATNLPTDGYTMVNANVSYRFRALADTAWDVFLRANNLLNVEARNHLSFLKEVAPLPARGVQIGLRGSF